MAKPVAGKYSALDLSRLSQASLVSMIKNGDLRYRLLPSYMRSCFTKDMFELAKVAISCDRSCYFHWIARSPAAMPPDIQDRDEYLQIQIDVALSMARTYRDFWHWYDIPDAVMARFDTAQVTRLLKMLVEGKQLQHRFVMYNPPSIREMHLWHVARILELCGPAAASISEEVQVTLGRAFPVLVRRMPVMSQAGRRCSYLKSVIFKKAIVLADIGQDVWNRDAEEGRELAHYAMDNDVRCYGMIPAQYKFDEGDVAGSLRFALKALVSDGGHYKTVPSEIKYLDKTVGELNLDTEFLQAPPFAAFLRYLVTDNLKVYEAIARAITPESDLCKYHHIPRDIIARIDARCEHGFSRAILNSCPSFALSAPADSPLLRDPEICRLAVEKYSCSYICFPGSTRAAVPGLAHKLDFYEMLKKGAVAAVSTEEMMDHGMPRKNIAWLQRNVLNCSEGGRFWLYQELMYAQPLFLRYLNEPLFRSLLLIYHEVYRILKLALGFELGMHVCRFIFGPEHLARVEAALKYPRELLLRMPALPEPHIAGSAAVAKLGEPKTVGPVTRKRKAAMDSAPAPKRSIRLFSRHVLNEDSDDEGDRKKQKAPPLSPAQLYRQLVADGRLRVFKSPDASEVVLFASRHIADFGVRPEEVCSTGCKTCLLCRSLVSYAADVPPRGRALSSKRRNAALDALNARGRV